MVERMTSVEIEDVLSSIRRLVTEDLRPKPVMVPVPSDDKLILTPALRVVPDAAVLTVPVLDVDLDADLAAALTGDTALADDETDSVEGSAAYPMFLHHANRVDMAADHAATDLADTVTTIGAGIPTDGYEAELGDVMPVPDWPESSWVAPDVIEVVEEAELIAVPETGMADAVHADWAPEDGAAHSFTPDAIPEATAEDDAAEAAAIAALSEDDSSLQDPAALTELDEDMLRDIVREIIREELHGGLGERITRNVRKLVRAEINRALMTQDLD